MDRVDWGRPLEAVPGPKYRGGKMPRVGIDESYARRPDAAPVRLSRNLWADDADGGTWYFNDFGLAVGGIGKDGYEGRFYIRNAAP